MSDESNQWTGREVAVVGMSGSFPGARDLDELWRLLEAGEEAVAPLDDEELRAAGVPESMLADPNYVKVASRLDGVDRFDAGFFGYSAREAELMDPQQRLFLEHAWHALEDGGVVPERFDGLIGIYAGVAWNTYLLSNLTTRRELFDGAGGFQIFIANDKDFMPTRASYKLDLKGPSMIVQTSCSTSLVAVHLAALSLLNYECDLALVGGVTVKVPQDTGYYYQEGGLASPDGHCRAFDADAAGTIFGSGVGVVALKRLSEALEDGDPVRAVIKGSAINNDGSVKVSYTAPSVEGQSQVIAAAQAVAEVHPDTIGYVEAHGTGTSLGDPIEVTALTRAFREKTQRKGYCALGSVKSNFGHLDAAAGIAGFIKSVLSVERGRLLPSVNFQRPNPAIDWQASPFRVQAESAPWPDSPEPRRAAVSSFGVGGTNAHVILEQAPKRRASGPGRRHQLLLWSARSEPALEVAGANLRRHLEAEQLSAPRLADLAYTLAAGRRVFRHRQALVCLDREGAVQALADPASARVLRGADSEDPRPRPVAFLFPGQGAQHPGMSRDLYWEEPEFRRVVDQCSDLLREGLDGDLRSVLYPEPGQEDETVAAARLQETRWAQPALFTVELALARLWMSWGVEPRAMVGHSVGELVAAHLAGVMGLEDALRLVAARGRWMQRAPAGSMVAVPLPEAELAPYLSQSVSLAAVNEPSRCVLSGGTAAMDELVGRLEGDGVAHRRLHTSHGFHSSTMDGVLEPFLEELRGISLEPPQRPYVSCLTGTWIRPEEATDPAYWARHLRQPVRFAAAVETVLEAPEILLLEVGPGRTLATLAGRHPAREDQPVISSQRHPQDEDDDQAVLLQALGRLWLAGLEIDWTAFYRGQQRARVAAPLYPFEHRSYWIEPRFATHDGAAGEAVAEPATVEEDEVGKDGVVEKLPPDRWFYVPSWRQQKLGRQPAETAGKASGLCLLLRPPGAFGDALAEALEEGARQLVQVVPGAAFTRLDARRFELDPGEPEHYRQLLTALGESAEENRAPARVVHGWCLGERAAARDATELRAALEPGFFSWLFLGRALGELAPEAAVTVLTRQAVAVTAAEAPHPEAAAMLGLVRVLPQEHPHLRCRAVDLRVPGNEPGRRLLARRVAEELDGEEDLVALRGSQRWVREVDRLSTSPPGLGTGPRSRGLYLITGGLEGNGWALAKMLARRFQARLLLPSDAPGPDAPGPETTERLERLRGFGAEVLTAPVDWSDASTLTELLRASEERWGPLRGVIHAAGTVGERTFRSLQETGREECGWHFESKVEPLWVLERGLEDLVASAPEHPALDFCVVLSSLATDLGGLAYGAYASANHALDAFAQQRAGGALPWRSFGWDVWELEDEGQQITALRADLARLAMTTEEGEEAFLAALAAEGPEVLLVSTGDLPARRRQASRRALRRGTELRRRHPDGHSEEASRRHPRPELESPYLAPRNEMEQRVARVWERTLGFEGIGVRDNFFELGGDSFVAVQVVDRLKEELGVALPVAKLFQGLTVEALAEILSADGGETRERLSDHLEERRDSMDRRRRFQQRRRSHRADTNSAERNSTETSSAEMTGAGVVGSRDGD